MTHRNRTSLMNTSTTATRPGALSPEQMRQQFIAAPGYRTPDAAPARRHGVAARKAWGGEVLPMMCAAEAGGRFSSAALSCPPTACTGSIALALGARSLAWRSPDAIENVVCVEGGLDVLYGPELDKVVRLGRFDMVSIPAGVRHQLSATDGAARVVTSLSVAPGGSYDAVFGDEARSVVDVDAAQALGVRFDGDAGVDVPKEIVEGRITRFDKLVPYKNDLNRTGGLPPEATESLSAGSVYPLIVPEGHIGRSRTAPMYGNQGLYISIAECSAGDDGPPPHAHSDTQESFYVLDGSFDICTGFDNESVVEAKVGDLMAMPRKVMRTFRNTSGKPARLLVIIQGPDRMQDTVSYSKRIGDDFVRRFGADILPKYAEIRMTFDAEERLGA
jgi:mannose-6-phosphate isomerase-like protein (cupin superfamily)